ncbi:hypothetical protein AGABI1DRAFT_112377 [Agaricus bisporus var. burnettii JB137-S8]|uniref:Uncharacterized protein n=1 Tax=Agaricus bisporus var. burnettii (strain JB137-S8 / ATCC MYA-4627 / FGSC 10392) TaxID=597362 RepID=K5XC12_AGABU|nr:uncharacterized protein AGABI1DRAFT_112377 [Agaricus bisporus var. burnettii JB137-S8]EKM80612.1 hypothetical protein AGABI1DRAFT_112377 [Agaricus bisporus var. burnettii JB137-S8]
MMYHERLDAKNLGLNISVKTLVTRRIELTALLGQKRTRKYSAAVEQKPKDRCPFSDIYCEHVNRALP